MRLARTATPLPRNLPGWSRTSGLRFPKPAGWPCSPTGRCRAVPPAGFEPAPSRLRAGRHDRSTTGARKVGGPGIEPGPARYQRAVPPRTPASDGNGRERPSSGGRIRTCASRLTVARLAARPRRNGRRGSRTPKALQAHPFSRRDTAPMAVLPKGPRQDSNLHCTD
jgi:hypothetical protein